MTVHAHISLTVIQCLCASELIEDVALLQSNSTFMHGLSEYM